MCSVPQHRSSTGFWETWTGEEGRSSETWSGPGRACPRLLVLAFVLGHGLLVTGHRNERENKQKAAVMGPLNELCVTGWQESRVMKNPMGTPDGSRKSRTTVGRYNTIVFSVGSSLDTSLKQVGNGQSLRWSPLGLAWATTLCPLD